MHPYSPIKVLDGRRTDISKAIIDEVDTGRNFIAVLNSMAALDEPCARLDCALEKFERLHKWGVHGLGDVLELRDYRELMAAHRDHCVVFFEQLNLRTNAPPRRKDFILYCEARGIISEHDSLDAAGENLLHYLESFNRAKLYPLAGIYEFRDGAWQRVKKLT